MSVLLRSLPRNLAFCYRYGRIEISAHRVDAKFEVLSVHLHFEWVETDACNEWLDSSYAAYHGGYPAANGADGWKSWDPFQ